LLEAKNRESTQEPELLTGVLDWLLGVNVNRSLARPIYATTPLGGLAARFANVRASLSVNDTWSVGRQWGRA
ncbi:MAG: hypothetical protein VB143_03265, partial [Burkholderia sp.]